MLLRSRRRSASKITNSSVNNHLPANPVGFSTSGTPDYEISMFARVPVFVPVRVSFELSGDIH